MARRRAVRITVIVLALLGVAQLIPIGHGRTNPPVTQEPRWDSAATRALAERACFDCHSNATRWPWYTSIAPASWLIHTDVSSGRSHLNFSEWDRPQAHARHAAEEIRDGGMPPWYYVPLHGTARLDAAEREALARGLEASLVQTGTTAPQDADQDEVGEPPVRAPKAETEHEHHD